MREAAETPHSMCGLRCQHGLETNNPEEMTAETMNSDNSQSFSVISFHYDTWKRTTMGWFGFMVLIVIVGALVYCCCTPRMRRFLGWGSQQQPPTYGYNPHQPMVPMMPPHMLTQPGSSKVSQAYTGATVEMRVAQQ